MRKQLVFLASAALLALFPIESAATEKAAPNSSVTSQKPDIVAHALFSARLTPRPRTRPMGLQLPPHPLATGLLNEADLKIYRQAFAAATDRQWHKARALATTATYKLPAKIIDWRWMTAYRNTASFEEIARFIEQNPSWPRQTVLQRRAEEALAKPVNQIRILNWFVTRTPITGIGMYRYGEALLENGKQTKGKSWIKQAWSVGNFPKKLERHILKKHLALFTQADHEKRLDRLLWERGATAATRMLPYVSKGQKKLAIARIRLMKMAGNVDAAVNSVPVELQNDPSLIYERAKWRRRKSLHDGSRELLLQIDETVPKAEKWWLERHIQARKLLAMGHVSDAYRLVSQHGLTEGGDFATAEWLSGWIALRFLGDHDVATKHFVRLFENVSFPISRARGAYWIGRTQLALNDTKKANFWFEIAARHYTTFYGQMALHEMGKRRLPLIPEINGPDASILTAYAMDERVMVIRHLGELEKSKWAKSFLLKMAEDVSRPEEYTYLAALATEIGRPDYAISVAKRAHQLGTDLTEINWPTKSVDLDNPAIELPLILAITRQESAFAIDAISSAGARGLMQLMPATAKNVSKKLNVSYSKSLLTEDANYNTLLGSSYLGNLIDRYNGSYVLAIASYNAGPSRVRSWIKEWGDPRTGEIDMVDWIELIPISETRNYVQRVIENLQVYRQRLNRNRISLLQIDKDINRGSETH